MTVISSLKVSVSTPSNGTLIAASTFGTSGKFFDGVVLPATGSYKVTIDPQTVSTGSVDVTGYVYANPLTQAVSAGTPATVTTLPGQNAQLTFTATAKMSFLFTGVTAGNSPDQRRQRDADAGLDHRHHVLVRQQRQVRRHAVADRRRHLQAAARPAVLQRRLDHGDGVLGSCGCVGIGDAGRCRGAGIGGHARPGRQGHLQRHLRTSAVALVLERHHRKPAVQPDHRQADRRPPARSSRASASTAMTP